MGDGSHRRSWHRQVGVLWFALLFWLACFERGGGDKRKAKQDEPTPRKPIVAAVADAAAGARVNNDATIRIRLATEPAHLNPFVAGEATVNRVSLGDVYEGLLCERKLGVAPVLCLARSVAVSDHGKQWTFQLRKNVRWHDGKPFSSADAAFTFRLLLNKKVVTWLRGDFGDLRQVDADGPDRLTLLFDSFRPGRRRAFARMPILPKHVFEAAGVKLASAAGNRKPIGTGPLRFAAWKTGSSITLERNDAYWGSKARVGRVVYRVIANRKRALAALAAGDLDLVTELPADEALAHHKRHPSLALFSYPRHAYLAAVHNWRKPLLANVDIRRALSHTLDRKSIARTMFHGYADLISGPFPVASAAYDPRTKPLVFGAKAAALAIRRSGLKKRGPIELLVPTGSRTMRRIADVWVQDAKPHLELKVTLVPYVKVLSRARSGKFDVALLAFTSSAELDVFTRLHSSQAGRENYGAVADKQLDALIEKARTTADPNARTKLQRAIHRRIHVSQPYTFIASDRRLGLARPGISGIITGAYGPLARALWRAR